MLFGQTWFLNQTMCFNQVVMIFMTRLHHVIMNMIKDMITWLKFNHNCKNVQVIGAFFWCNVSTIVINVPLVVINNIQKIYEKFQ